MTDQQISALGPAFSRFLQAYRGCFLQDRTRRHFDNYCRGLLSDLPRKSVEPIALASGPTVRTLQEFLATSHWDHGGMLRQFQRRMVEVVQALPRDSLGVVGVIDETSCVKKGDQTPGVQRQYLGCVGKVENGIVTVHVGVAVGRFRTLLDADLFLPKSWAEDRDRCRAAGIPDDVGHRTKWRIAFDQLLRLHDAGHRFDWLTFDEGYGAALPFLKLLMAMGQKFVAEVPVNFWVRTRRGPRRADAVLTAGQAKRGRRYRIRRETQRDQVWRAVRQRVVVAGRRVTLVIAINESTAEVKYFLTAATASVKRVLAVAFRRATVEHLFRVAKQEVGLMHYEGRQSVGLTRHLILSLLVLGFAAIQTNRLRGGKIRR